MKTITIGKEENYIMIHGSAQEEDIPIINIHVHNIGPHQYIRDILLAIKEGIFNNTIMGNFNTPLMSMERSSRQKINKETLALSGTLYQRDLIYKTEHSIRKQQNTHILFKCTWNILQDRPTCWPLCTFQ